MSSLQLSTGVRIEWCQQPRSQCAISAVLLLLLRLCTNECMRYVATVSFVACCLCFTSLAVELVLVWQDMEVCSSGDAAAQAGDVSRRNQQRMKAEAAKRVSTSLLGQLTSLAFFRVAWQVVYQQAGHAASTRSL